MERTAIGELTKGDKMRKMNELFEELGKLAEENTVWNILRAMGKWHIGEVIEILKHVRIKNDKN